MRVNSTGHDEIHLNLNPGSGSHEVLILLKIPSTGGVEMLAGQRPWSFMTKLTNRKTSDNETTKFCLAVLKRNWFPFYFVVSQAGL